MRAKKMEYSLYGLPENDKHREWLAGFRQSREVNTAQKSESPQSSASTSTHGVIYKPLDFVNFEFRLLTLLQSESSEPGLICCKLDHAYLDDPPQYHALSYCWGDEKITLPIQVNGSVVQVATNLEAALRELEAQNVLTIWVDALCINQQDSLERGLQLMRMGLIYSRAVEVIAWLGPQADESDIAMSQLANSGGSYLEVGDYKPVRDLFRRPYWNRVWIIQEISKARELQALCGNQRISWDQFTFNFPEISNEVPPEIRTLNSVLLKALEKEHSRSNPRTDSISSRRCLRPNIAFPPTNETRFTHSLASLPMVPRSFQLQIISARLRTSTFRRSRR